MNLAIFASGTGSNTEKIIEYFKFNLSIHVALVLCNRKEAGVLKIASNENIPSIYIKKEKFQNESFILDILNEIDCIILAGFLLKVPDYLIQTFRNKIINIHPALLPKFGGKGMYGMNVHKAVKEAGETETGITIHLVDEIYDNGEHLAQFSVDLNATETVEEIALKVLKLEHEYFPLIIEHFIENKFINSI
jgi:phosphoribosylglycinamide formyltransferase-1